MAKVFLNLHWEEGTPSVEDVARKLAVDPEDLDRDFGVIEVDPEEHLYTILIEQAVAERLDESFKKREGVQGPFSDPKIEPFDLQ